jgi:hypothetical protein
MKDGRRLVCVGRGSRIVSVDANSGQPTDVGLPANIFALAGGGIRLAMNDTQLFFLRGSQSSDIWVARFEQPANPQ